MTYTAALCALNSKYIHSSLAPWCLLAGVQAYAPHVAATVVEGTINEPQGVVLQRILDVQPQVVTLSCYLWNITQTLALAAALKAAAGEIVIVLGGPEVSYCATAVLLAHTSVDYILAGEGEESLPALLECLAAGDTPQISQQGAHCASSGVRIGGLCTRQGESPPCTLTRTPPSPYTPEYLAALHGRIAYLETSRGCPYHCAFCLSGRCGAPRWFPLETAKAHLLTLGCSGAKTVKCIDRTFNANPAHANALLEFLLAHYGKEIPQGVCFHFEIAADILREETFALLAKAPPGAFQLEIGMQSFHAPTLEAVRRKTNVAALRRNVERLVALKNMHIHIDLIAGLPQEDLPTFAKSFDIGYALNAQMLQLGFLKLLYGAPMREEAAQFPCTFSPTPPYEVTSTPWLSPAELTVLRQVEDALEKTYNCGRFLLAVEYVLTATGLAPFAFFRGLGAATQGLGTHHVPLDDYTALFFAHCEALPGVSSALLRDALVRDRLATNATGRLPACLQQKDVNLAKAAKALGKQPQTAPHAGVRRGIALLYGAKTVCWVDYTQKHPVTGRYTLQEVAMQTLFASKNEAVALICEKR